MSEGNTEILMDEEKQNRVKITYKSVLQNYIPPGMQAALDQTRKCLCANAAMQVKGMRAITAATQLITESLVASISENYSEMLKISADVIASSFQLLNISNRMGTIIDELANSIQINLPKIELPKVDQQTYNRWKFISIASDINFPIYFEVNTKLQDSILEIVTTEVSNLEERTEKIEKCIMEYYNHEVLHSIMDVWLEQSWIDQWQKEALEEAIEDYEEGRYYSAGSILMCQLGGLITRLYDATKTLEQIPQEEKKEILSLYDIGKTNSEKAKVIQMMSIQDQGILLWERSADYFVNYIYSSSGDMRKFTEDPGRNKICHGELTNYGTQKHALKAILVIDIVFQLGLEMLSSV